MIKQLLFVTMNLLHCFEWDQEWKQVGQPIPVVIGENGLTAGKREGDGKTPVGIFPLGPVFGQQAQEGLKMPYLLIDDELYCVDDPASPEYNQFVRGYRPRAERMMHPLYTMGIVIGYNTSPVVPGAGSCIFMHVWRGQERGTAGCVALDEDRLRDIVAWLDAEKKPHLIISDAYRGEE